MRWIKAGTGPAGLVALGVAAVSMAASFAVGSAGVSNPPASAPKQAGVPAAPQRASESAGSGGDLVERGRYLANAGDCMACHTAKNGKPFAGGLSMRTPFGSLTTPNITPDVATGIGSLSDDQFYRVMHEGIGRHGEYLYPVMPFPWYTNVTREDVLAIKAYLFSLAPVHQPRAPSHMTFPFSIRQSLAAWREVFFKPHDFQPDPGQSAEVNRGAYLVNGLGHCGECHDSRVIAGTSKFQKPLQGGVVDNWYAPNITSDVRDGIGGWSNAQLVQYLKTGSAPGKGVAIGPMAETIHSLSRLSDGDLAAIAAYLKSTPASGGDKRRDSDGMAVGARAQKVYLDNCASCHGVHGEGLDGVVPALAGNAAVLTAGPQNVLQAVLGGLEARRGYAPMLAIGAGMDDADIAEVTNFVRQSWGNQVPSDVSASDVYELRSTIDTPMTLGRASGCPAVTPPALAQALADPRRGIAQQLAMTRDDNLPQQVGRIVRQLPSSVTAAPKDEVVNALTAAYCKQLRPQAQADWNRVALQLGHFSMLVYTELTQAASGQTRAPSR